ncbi:phospholipase A and acyltransferase 3 [Callorhinchus milii]|uniref:HRAS-like suppressor 3 n=1 Tax=Callorhinchus milii TaxID=7868 RepID=A0A4W3HBP8_CALMI|nr:phospholipase A and acyltransferase 3 [Callorhinchus milii]|eukprot:gi/632987672/ref/XP_007882685.1/ PREDICTED: HRAS-like suppressor 3 isoform X2 [Callorhinchus milii]
MGRRNLWTLANDVAAVYCSVFYFSAIMCWFIAEESEQTPTHTYTHTPNHGQKLRLFMLGRVDSAPRDTETCVSRTQQLNVSEWGTARASAIDRAVTGHMDLDIHHVEPKPGDQIEIFRQTYQHWAIYVGNGYVIHITLPNKACSGISLFGVRALVKKELLRDVHRGDHYQVNNTLDSLWPPRAAEDIVRDAEKFVGLKVSYKLLKANCEHFITRLRYGADWSGQVWRFLNLLYVMGIPVSLRVRKHLYKLKRQSKPS